VGAFLFEIGEVNENPRSNEKGFNVLAIKSYKYISKKGE
jgi:hypothetical protein